MGAESSKTAGPLVLKPDDLTAHEAPATYTDGDLVDQEEGGWSEEQGDPRAVVVVPAILMTIYERVKLQLPDGSSTEPLWCLQNRTGNYRLSKQMRMYRKNPMPSLQFKSDVTDQ